MYTQCPQCLTYFQVTPEHLRIAQGNVRCGQCRNVFSALGNLTEEPPKTAYQDNDAELEDEIFIDEDELEEYGEEFVENYEEPIDEEEYPETYGEEELPEEYEEEFYIVEEEAEQEHLQQPPAAEQPLDLEKTIVGSSPGADQHANRHNLRPQVPSANINSKLSEAIATIERLKQSYTNLSIRKLEQPHTPVAGFTENSADTPAPMPAAPRQVTPERNQPSPPAAATFEVEEPPSSAEIFSPFIEKREEPPKIQPTPQPPRPSDVAIEHYPDDDGVDYEEALSALNELKILEEEEASDDEAVNNDFAEKITLEELPMAPLFDEPPSPAARHDFPQDTPLHIDNELRGREGENHHQQAAPEERKKAALVKIKSLRRTPSESKGKAAKPAAPPPPPTADLATQPPATNAATNLPAIPKQLLEDFHPGHGHVVQPNRLNALWAVGSLTFMLMFLIQTVYFKHNDLAHISTIRPWIETFCGYLSCSLNLPSDVKQLELVSQDIRSHPKVKSALLVTTTIINNARFAQAYPGLQITFTDLNGQRVAMRRFAPNEYLPPDVVQADGMPPNTPIQVELELMDPGSNAVNFEFDFIPLS